ncbi:MAG TPA: anti-sigma factor [Pyrinomonadaceae bacterium]|nr:anti-sigma factor [Pyrinomonadaceae bacterium]
MNCEKCQVLISDFLDGSLSQPDQSTLTAHLDECLSCADVRNDLQSILGYCAAHRGEYSAPPNEQALWLRIRNVVEAETVPAAAAVSPRSGWFSRTWELSFPQLAALVAVVVLVVALSTVVGVTRYQRGAREGARVAAKQQATEQLRDRFSQQQQLISFWNQRVEYNKTRWSPQMRETFDRNLQVIDQAVSDSMNNLGQNPHDEVSEEMLNSALNEKLALLKEFAEL